MEQKKEEELTYSVWVDAENRIVTFRSAEGFKEIRFPTHEQMLSFAVEKCYEGYRIL